MKKMGFIIRLEAFLSWQGSCVLPAHVDNPRAGVDSSVLLVACITCDSRENWSKRNLFIEELSRPSL